MCWPKEQLAVCTQQRCVPWLRRSVAGWPCHGSGGLPPVGRAMAQAVCRRLAVPWLRRSVAGWPCHRARRSVAGWPCHGSGGLPQVGRAMGSGGQSPVGRAMAQAVSHRPLTAEVHVRSQDSAYEIFGGQSGTLTGFSPSTSVSPLSTIPPALQTRLHPHVDLTRRTTTQNMRAFQKGKLFRKFGECWITKYFHNTNEDMTEPSVMYALRPKK